MALARLSLPCKSSPCAIFLAHWTGTGTMTSSIMAGLLHRPGQSAFLNPALMAMNVFEFDVPQAILDELAPLAQAARTMEEDKATYALPCGQRLYNQRPPGWKSDICWLSNADEAAYWWFDGLFRRLKLDEAVAPFVAHDSTIRLYSGFLVTRSRCEAHDMHHDWLTGDNTAFTIMAPLTANACNLGLAYRTIRGDEREYRYSMGKGVAFGSGFLHSTATGQLDERAVFLSLTFGTDRMDEWETIEKTAGRQGRFFCQPDGVFRTIA
jgi:hypothetical protein